MALILLATAAAIAETEPLISQGREALFRAFELLFGMLFLAEYAARLWTAVDNPRFQQRRLPRVAFAVTPAAIVDLLAIVPVLLAFGAGGSLVLRLFRVLRILRLAKLGRMSTAWRHIVEAVHSRRHELGLTLALAAIAMLASSIALYWAEGDAQPDKFGSIPRALWWSVVTLTTVGYGDVFPITPLGRFLSAVVAVIGIGLIALPTGILAAAFSDALQRRREASQSSGEHDGGTHTP
ncbi:MAG: ion transporter [Pseudomonadota bacterium]|nr:ion transporter [Pseudomonadota bacterium]